MHIQVTTLSGPESLTEKIYRFYVRDASTRLEVVFDSYVQRSRKSRRHRKFEVEEQWDDRQASPTRLYKYVPKPELTRLVREMVEHEFRKSVRFPWSP